MTTVMYCHVNHIFVANNGSDGWCKRVVLKHAIIYWHCPALFSNAESVEPPKYAKGKAKNDSQYIAKL